METVSQTLNMDLKSNERSLEQQINKSNIDWEGHREYLNNLNMSKKEIQNKLGYGKTYYYILEKGNTQDFMKASNGCRVYVMRALSTL